MGAAQQHSEECRSFLPGHRLHWTSYKHASSTPGEPVLEVIAHEFHFEVVVPGRPSMLWRHHDQDQLRIALENTRQPVLAAVQWRMLRVDGVWFNCVPAEAELTLCV